MDTINNFELTFLGVRGSMPIDGEKFKIYGGQTSCILLRVAGQVIVLDAGSGFYRLNDLLKPSEKHISLLLSHTHIDHILGLPGAKMMYSQSMSVDIYGATFDGMDIKTQLSCYMKKPLLPTTTEDFRAKVSYFAPKADFKIGQVSIKSMPGSHPGGSTVYSIEHDGKKLVYATDFSINEQNEHKIADFARDCSLLIMDGQYSDSQWSIRQNYGHSSRTQAVDLALKCKAQRLCIFHHDPTSDDDYLQSEQKLLQKTMQNSFFAKSGEVVHI